MTNMLERRRAGKSMNSPRDLMSLQRDVVRLFEDFLSSLSPAFGVGDQEVVFNPQMDIEETDSEYLFHFDVPGVKKEDIRIELQDRNLVVTGERKEEHKEEKGSRRISERSYGSFYRAFSLPSNINADQIEANYENGVLSLALPKAEVKQAKTIPISDGRESISDKTRDDKPIDLSSERKQKTAKMDEKSTKAA